MGEAEFNTTRRQLIIHSNIIADRKKTLNEQSYISSLFKKGLNTISQKVGEEAIELIIEAKDTDADKFKNEAADLLFHYLILLKEKDCSLNDVVEVLQERHQQKTRK